MNREPFIQVNEIEKRYPGTEKSAVECVSLSLHSGKTLALLGPNGAGKTTMVKMIAGLVLPTSGSIRVLGHDMMRARIKGVRHIGAVLEGARNLYWRLSALENLRYFGSLRLVPRRELPQRIEELLALFGLEEHRHQEVRQFSRGMQQKLAIAAALLHDPEILLLDEPTLGLDVQAAKQLETTIAQLAQEQGKAILLTSHMIPLAEKLADHIFVIHQGREVAFDTTRSLLERYNTHQDITEIQVTGQIPQALIANLQQNFPVITAVSNTDTTLLSWSGQEQAQLLQLLQILDEQGQTILDVGRRQASLEEVFLSLTGMVKPNE